MVESKTKFEEIRKWVSDHKLRTVGNYPCFFFFFSTFLFSWVVYCDLRFHRLNVI